MLFFIASDLHSMGAVMKKSLDKAHMVSNRTTSMMGLNNLVLRSLVVLNHYYLLGRVSTDIHIVLFQILYRSSPRFAKFLSQSVASHTQLRLDRRLKESRHVPHIHVLHFIDQQARTADIL